MGNPEGVKRDSHESVGTGLGLTLAKEVCGTAWEKNLGRERSWQGLQL